VLILIAHTYVALEGMPVFNRALEGLSMWLMWYNLFQQSFWYIMYILLSLDNTAGYIKIAFHIVVLTALLNKSTAYITWLPSIHL